MGASQVMLVVKNLPGNAQDARDMGSVPGSGRSPGVGNGNPLQYSCLENFMDRKSWWATVWNWDCKELDTTECARERARAHTHTHTSPYSHIVIYWALRFQHMNCWGGHASVHNDGE